MAAANEMLYKSYPGKGSNQPGTKEAAFCMQPISTHSEIEQKSLMQILGTGEIKKSQAEQQPVLCQGFR